MYFQIVEYVPPPDEFEIMQDDSTGAMADGRSSSSGKKHQQAVPEPKRYGFEKFQCEHCGKMFKHLAFLNSHLYTHRKLNMTCPLCERKHDFGCPYRDHKYRDHCGHCCASEPTKEVRDYNTIATNNFWCSVCNRKWATSSLLREHQKRAHNLETPENHTSAGEEAGMNNANGDEVRTLILFCILPLFQNDSTVSISSLYY